MHELALGLEAHPALAAWTQTLVLAITAGLVIWYAWETRRMAEAANNATKDNREMMDQLEELVRSNSVLAESSQSLADETRDLVDRTADVAAAGQRQVDALEARFNARMSVAATPKNDAADRHLSLDVEVTNQGPGAVYGVVARGWCEWASMRQKPKGTAKEHGAVWPAGTPGVPSRAVLSLRMGSSVREAPGLKDDVLFTVFVTWRDGIDRIWGCIREVRLSERRIRGDESVTATERAWPPIGETQRELRPDDRLMLLVTSSADETDGYGEVRRLIETEGNDMPQEI